MKRSEFLEFLTRFANQPIPATINRHVYLWIGEMDALFSSYPPGFIQKLDLHALCRDITKTPNGDKAAGRELSGAMDDWILRNLITGSQQAILVTGIDLLYRYRLPLSVFIQLASEKNVIILALSALDVNFRPAKPLPSYILFSPYAILKYAASVIPEEAIVKED
ncbi:MAG: hypothetical protein ROW48_05040 [Bellilinea sp.]|jgi:hypothetical protein